MVRLIGFACLVLSLTGCDIIPRGAGLQSEVLAVARDTQTGKIEAPDFSVEIVTRDNLTAFLNWPEVGQNGLRWINRVDQPNTQTIAAGDTVSITIWNTEDNGLFTTDGQRFVTLPDMRVSSSGQIFLPYIGDQRIAGMSPDRARARIQESYGPVAPTAQVQLNVAEGRQRSVSLVSGVSSPGTYPLPDNDFTILQLIADGGGVPTGFQNPQVRLQRGGEIYGTSVTRLLNNPSLDTTLRGGDRVFVQEDDRTFLSLGAAGTEAVHTFTADHLTALEALSIIGGVSDTRADAKGILILRRYRAQSITADASGPNHPRTVFTLDLTSADGLFSAGQFLIMPDDLIYVTESPVTAASSILGLFGTVLGVVR